MDEAGSVWLREYGRNCCEESLHLDFTMGAQTGGYAVEICVVVAGMADQFKGPGWVKSVEDLGESARG